MEKKLQELLEEQGDNYILPFYWQHGEEGELLREGMKRIRECGIRAVCVEARPHPDYVGELWWRDMNEILSSAREMGMKVWILDDSHFPTGRCNDRITQDSPFRKIVLTQYGIDVMGPMKSASFIVDLKENERFIGAVAAKKERSREYCFKDPQDITACYRGDVLEWDVPEGLYTVIIIKTTDQHTARQGYANLIDRAATRFLLDTVYEPHFQHYREEFGGTIAGFFSDEPEIGNTFKDIPEPGNSYAGVPGIPLPWCQELEEELHKLWKKEYYINLAILWNNVDAHRDTNRTGKIRKEYTELVTKLYRNNFCEQIGDWCREHHVEYIGHVIEDARFGVGVGHYFRGLWGQDMAGIDVVLQSIRPEFDDFTYYRVGNNRISGTPFNHYGLAKLAASLAHIDPKKKGRAFCEIFGAYGWTEGVKLMKWLADHMLVRGINYYVPHAFTMKDFPDSDCPPHFYARGNNPQFPFFKQLMNYVNRVCHLINGGRHCANVAILYSADLEWMERNVMHFHEPAKELTQNQVDFDVLPLDIVLEGKIENRTLLCGEYVELDGKPMGGERFTMLIIPECRCVDRTFADWCREVISRGFRIICVNALPLILQEDGRLTEWNGECPEVILLKDIGRQLNKEQAGLNISKTDPYLRYYHYIHKCGEYYLFFNEAVTYDIETEVEIGAVEKNSVLEYDAWKNQLKMTSWDAQRGKLLLELQPYEMKIIYVGEVSKQMIHKSAERSASRKKLDVAWSLYLKKEDETGYIFYKQVQRLENITAQKHFPFFCGTIKYEAQIELEEKEEWVYLDFGDVYEAAQLQINGKHVGSRITPPYRFEIQGLLEEGNNIIELEVTNTLVHQVRDRFSVSMPVEPSGLLGPVYLE